MKVSTTWKTALEFEGKALETSLMISPDHSSDVKFMDPHDLLLLSISSSSGIEVMKRLLEAEASINLFNINAEGTLKEVNGVPILSYVNLVFSFQGQCEPIVVINAVEHSQYVSCGIGALLSRALTIRWIIVFNGKEIADGVASYDYSINKDEFPRKY